MQTPITEFNKLALERYGEKLKLSAICPSQEVLDAGNEKFHKDFTAKDFEDYGEHLWLYNDKCPECGSDLLGIFGSFHLGIVHGTGNCSDCSTEFRYYHYVKEVRMTGFSLIGMIKEEKRKR